MTKSLSDIIDKKEPSLYTFDSHQKGNTTTVMVGVHGNELAGPKAMLEIMENLQIENGKNIYNLCKPGSNRAKCETNRKKYE